MTTYSCFIKYSREQSSYIDKRNPFPKSRYYVKDGKPWLNITCSVMKKIHNHYIYYSPNSFYGSNGRSIKI